MGPVFSNMFRIKLREGNPLQSPPSMGAFYYGSINFALLPIKKKSALFLSLFLK